MRHTSSQPPVSLPVSVSHDAGSRTAAVHWQPPGGASTFAHARIFLTGPDLTRTYLGVVDTGEHADVELPDAIGAGPCTIEVETYSSGSWGGGRLTGSGRSDPFDL